MVGRCGSVKPVSAGRVKGGPRPNRQGDESTRAGKVIGKQRGEHVPGGGNEDEGY